MSSDLSWFYADNLGSRFGPFSTDEMLSLLGRSVVARDTRVWRIGFDDWVAAKDATELDAVFVMPPVAAPIAGVQKPIGVPAAIKISRGVRAIGSLIGLLILGWAIKLGVPALLGGPVEKPGQMSVAEAVPSGLTYDQLVQVAESLERREVELLKDNPVLSVLGVVAD